MFKIQKLLFLILMLSLGRVYCAKNVVLVTGGAGFIGSNFIEYMFDKYPDYEFIILDALTYAGNLENIPEYIRESKRFKFYYGTVCNFHVVERLMQQADYVVHFAAESHVTRSISDDTTFFETDVMGTRVMMTALVKYRKRVKRFIHISTSEVLGSAENEVMDESHPLNPRSPYAAAKTGADRLVYSYCATFDVPAVIVRPFNNYGPRQHLEKVIPRFIASAINKEPLTIHGTGEQERDWLHTLDLARALDKILHHPDFDQIKHQVFHVGTGRAISINHIAQAIASYFDLPQSSIINIGDRPGQVQRHISSTEKAERLLGWKAQIPFEEGLKDTIRWFLKNRDHWKKNEIMKYVPIYTNDDVVEMH